MRSNHREVLGVRCDAFTDLFVPIEFYESDKNWITKQIGEKNKFYVNFNIIKRLFNCIYTDFNAVDHISIYKS